MATLVLIWLMGLNLLQGPPFAGAALVLSSAITARAQQKYSKPSSLLSA
jgi:hypothetical protein